MLSNAPRAFEGESSGQDGVVMVTVKGGEAAVADAAASSGIRAPNKKSPLPRAGSGHAHIVSSFPAGGIPVSGYTLSARFPWASPLGNANSEVFRILFFHGVPYRKRQDFVKPCVLNGMSESLVFFSAFAERLRQEEADDRVERSENE